MLLMEIHGEAMFSVCEEEILGLYFLHLQEVLNVQCPLKELS